MVGRGDPPPRAAFEGPDIAAQAHAVQLQLMAMASRPAASHGVHGAPGRGSILGLGGGGRGSARGTGRQGRGRGRAQGDNAGQGNGPPLGSGRAGDAAGQGDGGQHDAAGDPSQSFRPPRPTTTNQTKKKETEGDGGQHNAGGDPSQLFYPSRPTSTNQTKKKGTELCMTQVCYTIQ